MTAARGSLPRICIAEDRQSCEPSIRLLIASLAERCGPVGIDLFHPDPTLEFQQWLGRYPFVTLRRDRVAGEYRKYDVKPQVLLTLLDEGHDAVLWLDSDMLICRDLRPLFQNLASDVLVITEEALCTTHQDPDALRARLWKLPIGRTLPYTANSSVMRVTPAHRNLLVRWRALLDDKRYRDAQSQYWRSRPPHLLGDQDVLTAVLASSDFAHVRLRYLRRGEDILQFFGSYGYTVRERLHHLRQGMPAFVHSQGNKPWWPEADHAARSIYARFNSVYLDLSPYTLLARKYRRELTDDRWMEPRSVTSSVLRSLGAAYPPLTGLPLAIAADVVRSTKVVLTRGRRALDWKNSTGPGTKDSVMREQSLP